MRTCSTFPPMQKRITVLLSEEELAQVRKSAGLVPLSAWIRNRIVGKSQPGGLNGSATHQDLSGVPETNSSGRRTTVPDRRNVRRRNNRVRQIEDITNRTIRATKPVERIQAHPELTLTAANFAEHAAEIPRDEIDSWARGLPREVLPGHSATSNRHTCLCSFCLEWRKANYIPYGGPVKKEKKR